MVLTQLSLKNNVIISAPVTVVEKGIITVTAVKKKRCLLLLKEPNNLTFTAHTATAAGTAVTATINPVTVANLMKEVLTQLLPL